MVPENALVLQDAFRENGYTNLLAEFDPANPDAIAAEYDFHLEDLFDSDQRPDTLLGLFISHMRDDLFLLLDGDLMDVTTLCDEWDKRIRVFTIMNRRSKAVEKLRYNIVQLVVYSGPAPDKSREANLQMSRKIIIKGEMTDKDRIIIDDEEAIELPFHMIQGNPFTPDQTQTARLNHLLPSNDDLLAKMKKKHSKVNRKEGQVIQPKNLDTQEYNAIRRWLEDDSL